MLAGTGTVIRFSEWVRSYWVGPDYYYSKMTLRDGGGVEIISVNNGTQIDPIEVKALDYWEEQLIVHEHRRL